jgi:hypothetical protein
MKVYSIDPKTYNVKSYKSKKHAEQHGNGFIIASDPRELATNPNTTLQILVNVYNNNSSVMTKKFSDKLSGAKRVFEVIKEENTTLDAFGEYISTKDAPWVDSAKKEVSKNSEVSSSRGKFSGKTIHCLVKENPRRQATKGFHSMGILINSGDPVKYEDYIEQGGRRQDLQWDLDRKYVEIKDSQSV